MADSRQDRRLQRDSVISEPGPGTRDAGDGNILVMADTEGCGAGQQILKLCHEKYSLSRVHIPCWAQK